MRRLGSHVALALVLAYCADTRPFEPASSAGERDQRRKPDGGVASDDGGPDAAASASGGTDEVHETHWWGSPVQSPDGRWEAALGGHALVVTDLTSRKVSFSLRIENRYAWDHASARWIPGSNLLLSLGCGTWCELHQLLSPRGRVLLNFHSSHVFFSDEWRLAVDDLHPRRGDTPRGLRVLDLVSQRTLARLPSVDLVKAEAATFTVDRVTIAFAPGGPPPLTVTFDASTLPAPANSP